MQIQIPKQKFKVTPRLRKHIEDKLQQGLGKFADRIGPVVVKCGTGSLNGSVQQKRCHIEMALQKQVTVEAADADIYTAVDRAVEQSVRSVTRVLEQEFGGSSSKTQALAAPKN
jgi:ribosomal subunit interface protein